ncbi:MAG: hypothetical protein KBF88_12235 [Polyangiaceae bacterium]|nr:hypothetical protein [Polyangiaceae bacterium]
MRPGIDPKFASLVAWKRVVTGSLGLLFAAGLVWLSSSDPFYRTPKLGVAIALFAGGGGWALRDGLRLRKDLREHQKR